MELYFRHHPTCCLPARGLVEKAFVPDHGLVARSSYGPRQQLRDVALQALVRGYADGILHASLLQRLIDFRLGKGSVGAKHHFLTEFLLALISSMSALQTAYVSGLISWPYSKHLTCCARFAPIAVIVSSPTVSMPPVPQAQS